MKNSCRILLIVLLLIGCQPAEKVWTFSHKIPLDEGVNPLGLALMDDELWISDPDNDKIHRVSREGEALETIGGFQRPMHIEAVGSKLYVPNFGADSIHVLSKGERKVMAVGDSLDAPSGISILDEKVAIADFYHHTVLLFNDEEWIQIGTEGRGDGQLYYPTDVKLFDEWVVVADAYNNRIQVFDFTGKFIRVIGWQENIKVATGVDVSEDNIYVTDFYGNRILVYDFDGNLLNTFENDFNKPTDILVLDDVFYVANYGEGAIVVYFLE